MTRTQPLPAARGEKHPRAKLTRDGVAECRRRFFDDAEEAAQLGREFFVNASTMRDAIWGRTWKTVPMPRGMKHAQ